MKKLALAILVVTLCDTARAEVSLEILKRGNLVYAYDFRDHDSKTGLMSPFVIYKDFSLDLGGIRSIDKGDRYDFAAGVSYHVGKVLGRQIGLVLPLPDGLLDKLFLSAFVSPVKVETTTHELVRRVDAHYGVYSGVQIKF